MIRDVWNAVEVTRQRLCEELGGVEPHEQNALVGRCHENAVALARELRKRHHDAYLVWGGIEHDDRPTPETLEEAEQEGCVHFWVEVPLGADRLTAGDDVVVADVSQHIPGEVGKPLVSTRLPDRYIRFEESRIPFSADIGPDDVLAWRPDHPLLYGAESSVSGEEV